MDLQKILQQIASEKENACVTISLNTHRTHPDNLQDEIVLKNLVKEAEERLKLEFESSQIDGILSKLQSVSGKIDINYLEDSLHIFISDQTEEIVKSMWPVKENLVYIDDHFAIRPLIIALNRTENYLILKLTQDATHLYRATNDRIVSEVENHVFPFGKKGHFEKTNIQRSDSEFMDTMIREHFRDIDKALIDFMTEENQDQKVVVICDEDNFSKLKQVANRPEIYLGYRDISHLDKSPHQLAKQAWEVIYIEQESTKSKAIAEMKEAVSQTKVITDLQEIYQASEDGRADLLIAHHDFSQPVKMIDERTFEYGNDPQEQGFVDDITSTIAWKVISNGGRAVFTNNDEIKDLGKIALKTRY